MESSYVQLISNVQSKMGLGKRRARNQCIAGLVTGTLKFARAYSDVDLNRTERLLEEELRRESCVPPADYKVARLRHRGEQVLHSKHVLLVIVILNLIDCALVLGELVLDIHYIKELRETSETSSQSFINEMQRRYPSVLHNNHIDEMDRLYDQIYQAECYWNITMTTTTPNNVNHSAVYGDPGSSFNNGSAAYNRTTQSQIHIATAHAQKEVTLQNENDTAQAIHKMTPRFSGTVHESTNNGPVYSTVTGNSEESRTAHAQEEKDDQSHDHEHSVWVNVAHGMHKASITILGILFVENILKLLAMGRVFFTKKLEVFDATVVILSFIIDLVFLKGLPGYSVQDALLILSFLLPWRVIRVVNSLIVAVLDHEHFRLKMLYQEKKVIAAELKILKEKDKKWDFHLQKIEKFCESEGIPKWKIRQHTAMGRKQSTITSMASLALNGLLTGMMTGPEDNIMFAKSMCLMKQESAASNLDIIDEDEDTSVTDDNPVSQNNMAAKEVHTQAEATELDSFTETNNNAQSHSHSILQPHSKMNKRVSFDDAERKPLLRQNSVMSRSGEAEESPISPSDSKV